MQVADTLFSKYVSCVLGALPFLKLYLAELQGAQTDYRFSYGV